MKTLRIYVDTSVIGGCYDDEFTDASKNLINIVRDKKIIVLVSNILVDELERAPENVQNVLTSLPKTCVEYVTESAESRALRDLYLEDGVVGK